MAKRKCGDCKACCTTVGVAEINKPKDAPCSYLCRKGCKIYSDRPESCKTFACGWLNGMGSHKHRPDRSGVIAWVEHETSYGMAIILAEIRNNALNRPEGREIGTLAKTLNLPVLRRAWSGVDHP